MTLGLKSSVFLVLIVSQVISWTFQIEKTDEEYDYQRFSIISVSYYKNITSASSETIKYKSGFTCVKLYTTINFSYNYNKKQLLNIKLYAPEDDEKYVVGSKKFEKNNVSENLDYVCLLWGTWWPSDSNTQSSPEIYFKVMPNRYYNVKMYIYNFRSILKNSTMNAYLLAEVFSFSFEQSNSKNFSYEDLLYVDVEKGKEFKVDNNKNLHYTLKDFKFEFSGDGDLNMALFVPKNEVEYFSRYSFDKDLNPILLKIAPKLTCKDNKFVFSHELPAKENPKQPGGFRLNILV